MSDHTNFLQQIFGSWIYIIPNSSFTNKKTVYFSTLFMLSRYRITDAQIASTKALGIPGSRSLTGSCQLFLLEPNVTCPMQETSPDLFRRNYPNTRTIFDCTEVRHLASIKERDTVPDTVPPSLPIHHSPSPLPPSLPSFTPSLPRLWLDG